MGIFLGLSGCNQSKPTNTPALPELTWSDAIFVIPPDRNPNLDKLSSQYLGLEIKYIEKWRGQSQIMEELLTTLEGVGLPYTNNVLKSQSRWRDEIKKCGSEECKYKMILARNLYLVGVIEKLKHSIQVGVNP